MLRYHGVTATLGLAQSPNSKMIVIGGGEGGLPVILNPGAQEVSPATVPAPAPATDPINADATETSATDPDAVPVEMMPPASGPPASGSTAPGPSTGLPSAGDDPVRPANP